MQFTTTAKRFRQGLEIVESVLPVRTPIPAAMHVKLSTKGSRLTLTATNLKSLIHYTCAVDANMDGVALVPAKKLLDFVKTLGDEEISARFDATSRKVFLTKDRLELELPTLPDDEFPEPPPEAGESFKIKQSALQEALRMTAFAASSEESRYILNGCCLYFEAGKCSVIATDGYRLARFEAESTTQPANPGQLRFVIPRDIAKILQDHLIHEDDVTITQGGRAISLAFETPGQDAYLLSFNQIEGNYPNCQSFIPAVRRASTLDRLGLLLALKRAQSVIDADGRVFFKFAGNTLEIEAKGTNTSAASNSCKLVEKLEVDYSGRPMVTSFRPRYIVEALEEMKEDRITFDLEGVEKPLILSSPSYTYLSQPLRA